MSSLIKPGSVEKSWDRPAPTRQARDLVSQIWFAQSSVVANRVNVSSVFGAGLTTPPECLTGGLPRSPIARAVIGTRGPSAHTEGMRPVGRALVRGQETRAQHTNCRGSAYGAEFSLEP